MNTTKRVVVDLDVGTDDALALLILLYGEKLGKLKIEGIICSPGNSTVENVTRNTLRLLEACNRTDIPIYTGAYSPIINSCKQVDYFHGADGFGDIKWTTEVDTSVIRKTNAAIFLNEVVLENPKEITLICLAPLTNLALTIRLYEKIVNNLKEIYIMGGNYTGLGNVTLAAEFNFYFDPEAAHIVFDSCFNKCPIFMLPWEPCEKSDITFEWRFSILGRIKTPLMKIIDLCEKSVYDYPKCIGKIWQPCDALLLLCLLQPNEFVMESSQMYAIVELHGHETRGQVVLDFNKTKRGLTNVTVFTKISYDYFKKFIVDAANNVI